MFSLYFGEKDVLEKPRSISQMTHSGKVVKKARGPPEYKAPQKEPVSAQKSEQVVSPHTKPSAAESGNRKDELPQAEKAKEDE